MTDSKLTIAFLWAKAVVKPTETCYFSETAAGVKTDLFHTFM